MKNFLELGLLNWFPLKKGNQLLLVGGNEVTKEDFEHRGMVVNWTPHVEDLVDVGAYDYIVVCNGDELLWKRDYLFRTLKKMLKKSGHLFFACRNRLALRNFVGDRDPYTGRSYDGIENYCSYTQTDLKEFHGRCYAKNEIEEFIKKMGFTTGKYRGYSIFPGLEMPQLFFSWDYLPKENLETRYTPLYNSAKTVFLKETNLCESLIQNGMFHQMANAYLLDCSFSNEFYEINQVTTSMERGEGCAMATILQKDGMVIKKALYPQGNLKIQGLIENTRKIKEKGIKVIDVNPIIVGVCDDVDILGVQMECVQAPLADKYLRGLVSIDREKFIIQTEKFLELVLKSGDALLEENSDLGPIYIEGYFDLVPINCFYKDGDFVFFDQEYAIEKYPINVVLTRVLDLIYMGNKDADTIVPISYFTDKYNLTGKLAMYRAMSTRYLEELKHSELLREFHENHKAFPEAINQNRQKLNYDADEYLKLFINYLDDINGKKIFLFGSGLWAKKFIAEYGDVVKIEAALDNNASRWGQTVEEIKIVDPNILLDLDVYSYKVIVCVKQFAAIVKQLGHLGVVSYGIYDPNVDANSYRFLQSTNESGYQMSKNDKESGENSSKTYRVGYVSGVFDLFHVGHLNLLRRAKEQCKYLIVGVVSDEQAQSGKTHSPFIGQQERLDIVKSCKFVDEAFILPIAAAGARDVFKKYHFDVLFSGDDYENDTYWLAEREWLRKHGSDIVFFPYTQSTSSTKLKEAINHNLDN